MVDVLAGLLVAVRCQYEDLHIYDRYYSYSMGRDLEDWLDRISVFTDSGCPPTGPRRTIMLLLAACVLCFLACWMYHGGVLLFKYFVLC